MKKWFFIAVFLLVILPSVLSGQKYTISGYVQDSTSGEKLIAASVYDSLTGIGTSTNEYGFFSLTLTAGELHLQVSYVGYATFRDSFTLDSDRYITCRLAPSITLEEVIITGNRPRDVVENVQMSMVHIPIKDIKSIPMFMGEADVIKTIQLMPGVQSGTEGTSGLYVRGGGPDQNLFLLDGVPIYNANHLFGFFSVFNPDAISNITLTKGGFPAHYGGRLSSVIDIRLKEGNMKEFRGSGSIGVISSKLTLEGPIIKDKTSFIVSARRTYIDILARPIIRAINKANGVEGLSGYYFYDLNAKINHKFSDRDRIYLSAYHGRDRLFITNQQNLIENDTSYQMRSESGLYWGNLTTALRWNHVYGSKLFSNTSLMYSNYRFDTFDDTQTLINGKYDLNYIYDYFSGIEDFGGMIDFDYRPVPEHTIRFGGKYLYHLFSPGVETVESTDDSLNMQFNSKRIYADEFYLYGEDNFQLGSRIRANAGLHYSGFYVNGKYYHSLQPRISGRLLITPDLSFKAAFSRMDQYIHLLTNSTIGLPTDLWVPATDRTPPLNSYQSAVGLAYNLKDSWYFTLEGFYKTMNNVIDYSEGSSFFEFGVDWEDKVERDGRGRAYGLEFLARRDEGRLRGWVGYTLSKAEVQFENMNNGLPFPYTYDRRHDVSVVVIYEISDRTDLSATWVYGTGKARSLAVSRYAPDNYYFNAAEGPYYYYGPYSYYGMDQEIQYFKGKNAYREPAYHRLDLSINRHKEKKWGTQTWSFGLYNAYNRQNPFYLFFGYDNYGNRALKQMSIFMMIPSISYSFNF
ncbi:MAG: TonB-dependent receptor [Bacteroidales bacterium]|nr:TonB-dependent receptor [Bacteroidales bacterium]